MRVPFARSAILSIACALLICPLISCNQTPLTYPTIPKFLIAIDGSGAGANVNVFPVDANTGALGPAVGGSPFNMGLGDPMMIEVHPNGHFAYVPDGSDGSIHSWNVNEGTGVPKEIGLAAVNASGSFFEPCCGVGNAAAHVIALNPKGNYLYSANNDSTVGAYAVKFNGTLTHIADFDIGACATGAITANNSYVWVTDTCSSTGPWAVYTLKIAPDGTLTNVGQVTLTGVHNWLWSIQVNPAANFLYVGDAGPNAQIYGFSIGSNGLLTQLGPPVVENKSSDCRFLVHSPDGTSFYTSDDADYLHAFSVNTASGAISELAASPYSGGGGQVAVDLTGNFVYIGDVEGTGQVVGYSRDQNTGALALIGNTTTANNAALAIGIIR
jgi:6-phosphogluconolactonase (cycloisomerase 2 family)